MRQSKAIISAALLFLCVLSGCNQREVVSNLDAQQSVRMLVILSKAGISGVREKVSSGRRERYRILVPRAEHLRAMEVLDDYGLPDTGSNDLSELTKTSSFSPGANELRKLRKDIAVGLQVERLVEALPGVVDVRAVVRTAQADALRGSERVVPRASIVIRFESENGEVPFDPEGVRKIVAQAVQELEPQHVIVQFSRAFLDKEDDGEVEHAVLPPFTFSVPASHERDARMQLGAAFVGLFVAGILVGLIALRLIYRRRLLRAESAASPPGLKAPERGKSFSRKPTLMIGPNEFRNLTSDSDISSVD